MLQAAAPAPPCRPASPAGLRGSRVMRCLNPRDDTPGNATAAMGRGGATERARPRVCDLGTEG